MRRSLLFFITFLIAALFVTLVHEPVSLMIFKIREPYFICPVKIDSKSIVIRNDAGGDGEFGAKRRNGRSHTGVDIQAPIGSPVYAAKSGIAFRGNVPTGYGKYVMIYHTDGSQTMYGHLSDWNIKAAQKVHRGDIVGYVGKTGNASSKHIEPHLHFEIKKEGEPQDPLKLMR